MDRKRQYCTVGVCAWLFVFPAVAKQSAAELLDEILRSPGSWSQMCASPAPLPFDVPIPLYSLAAPRYFSLTEKNCARLVARRDEIVPEIVRRLSHMELTNAVPSAANENHESSFGQDPHGLNGVLLQIIFQLEIIEAAPQLLRLEEELELISKNAQNNGQTNLPPLSLGSPIQWKSSDHRLTRSPLQYQIFAAHIYQSELLALMAGLLREKRYGPMLNSDIEAKYLDCLKQNAKDSELRNIKKLSDIPSNQKEWITIDPIHNLPVRTSMFQGPGCSIPNTPQIRSQIRQLVKDYLESADIDQPSAKSKTLKKK